MKKIKIQNIILYIINAFLIGFILLSNKGNLLNNSKIILKNMDESTQVSELNKSIDDLNKEHTEYSNYIQASKANLAQAITNAGINTNANDDFEIMANNISNLITNKTSNATAIANNISEGKTAWVNGELIIGTGADNEAYYNQGYIDGQKNSSDNIEIQYTYHKHEGSEGPTANGCYIYPVYHQHEDSCYCPGPSKYYLTHWIDNGKNTYQRHEYRCQNCGGSNGYNYSDPYGGTAGFCVTGTVLCPKTPGGTIDSYTLGCGKTEETVESATIIYKQ